MMGHYQKRACEKFGCSEADPYPNGIIMPKKGQPYADYLSKYPKEILVRWLCAKELECQDLQEQDDE